MKPVDQDDFTFTTGNCFSACLASLLELPLASVPKFMAEEDWFGAVNRWLSQFNLRFIDIKWDQDFAVYPQVGGYAILTGPSPRNPEIYHSIVVLVDRNSEGKVTFYEYHDPHPDRGWIAGEPASVGFLAVIDPAKPAGVTREGRNA